MSRSKKQRQAPPEKPRVGFWDRLPEPVRGPVAAVFVTSIVGTVLLTVVVIVGRLFGLSVDPAETLKQRGGVVFSPGETQYGAMGEPTSGLPEIAAMFTEESLPETVGSVYRIESEVGLTLPRNTAIAPRQQEIVLMTYVVSNTSQRSFPLDVARLTLRHGSTEYILHEVENQREIVPASTVHCFQAWFVSSPQQARTADGRPMSVQELQRRLDTLLRATPSGGGAYGGYDARWRANVELSDGREYTWSSRTASLFGGTADVARQCTSAQFVP